MQLSNGRVVTPRMHSYRMDPDYGPVKRCSMCKEEWPADTEFFPANSREKSGLMQYCYDCHQTYKREWKRRKASGLPKV